MKNDFKQDDIVKNNIFSQNVYKIYYLNCL